MSLRLARLAVLDAGPRTIVVDRGRRGHEHLGLAAAGAADPELLAAALAIAGAPPDAAALEVTASGPVLECRDGPVRVSVAGHCAVTLLRAAATESWEGCGSWRALTLARGDRIRVGALRGTLRAYVAAGSGLAVAPQLGSRSTSLRGGLVGMLARPLRTGDVLPVAHPARPAGPDLVLDPRGWLLAGGPLRVCPGPQEAVLGPPGLTALEAGPWRVSPLSDRAGVRLDGPPLALRAGTDVPPQGCPPGAVQVGGDGLPIILGCDRGTTGGYAVVAVVASADLARLGRLRPGEAVGFQAVDVAEALEQRGRRAVLMATLPSALRPVPA